MVAQLVWEPSGGRLARRPDELAVEEPLEIRIRGSSAPADGAASTGAPPQRPSQVMTVTMRTPGHDFELALGWLFAEGVVIAPDDVRAVRYCTDSSADGEQRYNVVTVDLSTLAATRLAVIGGIASRLTVTSSSCGVCGSASIEAVLARGVGRISSTGQLALDDLLAWPELLRREGQEGFEATGALHAAGLVSEAGELLVAREDVGRHNAVDKVVGWAVLEALEGRLSFPLSHTGLVVSGRASFEIVQKALVAGIPVVAAVSAATSLAARLADDQGLTLVGFIRGAQCTIYSHPERLNP